MRFLHIPMGGNAKIGRKNQLGIAAAAAKTKTPQSKSSSKPTIAREKIFFRRAGGTGRLVSAAARCNAERERAEKRGRRRGFRNADENPDA